MARKNKKIASKRVSIKRPVQKRPSTPAQPSTTLSISDKDVPKKKWENIVLHYLSKLKNYWYGKARVNDEAHLRKALKMLPLDATRPSNAHDIVEQALQYGLAHGVVKKRGAHFQVIRASSTPSPATTVTNLHSAGSTLVPNDAAGCSNMLSRPNSVRTPTLLLNSSGSASHTSTRSRPRPTLKNTPKSRGKSNCKNSK